MGVFNTTLVLGGARSGKTAHALGLCETASSDYGLTPVYVATAQAFDTEMEDRIARHQAERGPEWLTVEAPRDLAGAIARESAADRILLVDCLTLWLTNVMLAHPDADPPQEALDAAGTELVACLTAAPGPVVLVSNEVGLGIVPENKLARRFRDEAGRLNQRIAAMAGRVVFIAAGLPLVLKGS
ncbi:MAG: bifunctional adenosylcobinamide kinase/adenosylcobinamide-phosphate guanylyltransferase [Alphaproteobacteria bacterium]|nr:bifunctional adenosylcobinamide kinase/adenosylcobinamide-phosphate guanylyltransferase [Alphaproteobacteria bacterium]